MTWVYRGRCIANWATLKEPADTRVHEGADVGLMIRKAHKIKKYSNSVNHKTSIKQKNLCHPKFYIKHISGNKRTKYAKKHKHGGKRRAPNVDSCTKDRRIDKIKPT